MDVVERSRPSPPVPDPPDRSRRRSTLLALVLALVAVCGAVLLPFAPVQMSVPTVTWPQDPTQPRSTMLELTSQRPLALDVRFGCAAVRAAADTPEGVVVSTLLPSHPSAATAGLSVTAREDRLLVLLRGRELLDVPVPTEDCEYRLAGDAEALTLTRDGAPLITATPTPTTVATAIGSGDGEVLLPDVDVLATSTTTLPDDAGLGVTLTVDDQLESTPSGPKLVLVVLVLLAAAGSLAALGWGDRRRRATAAATDGEEPVRLRSGRGLPRVLTVLLDVGVVATAVLWLFLAQTSDDDGYYAAMARNADDAGFVGNYFQLLNQSFVPFTWSYRVLGWWQQLGDAPVLLRVPSLVAGLVTWLLLRRLITRPGVLPAGLAASRWGPPAVQLLLAAAFLAWWLPYGIGVRPEAVVGVLALATLVGVLAALRTGRLLPLGLAVLAAGMAATCHPTGFVALGPLLVALPRLVRLVADGASRLQVATRTALLLAPGGIAAVAAFADGTLHDFLRGQEIFLSVQQQNSAYDEIQRYNYLLGEIPMGSYARRAAVLTGLVALLWALVALVVARVQGVRLPVPLVLSAQALGAGFGLLVFTPSKWTHHFGALSGLGPAFLAVFLATVPWLVRTLARDRPLPTVVPVLAVGSVVVTTAMAMHGPNSWPYTWLPGMPQAGQLPSLGPVALDSPLTWTVVAVAVLAVARRRRRGGPWWAGTPPVLVVVSLLTSVAYLLGTTGLAALRTLDTWSPGAAALTDPLAADCGAAAAVDVLDVSAARPLEADPSAPATGEGDFAPGAGWWAPSPPPAGVGQVWGSLIAPGGEDTTGDQSSPWYPLPEVPDGESLVVLGAGQLAGGNALLAEYARPGSDPGAQPEVVDVQDLADGVDDARWRTLVLDAAGREDGAQLVRLVARDRSGGPGGWLAFTAPSLVPQVPLTSYLPDDAPVAVAWQVAFQFPCQRQPGVSSGITEPVTHGVLWRYTPDGDGLADNTWLVSRGGLYAPVQRTSAVTELGVVLPATPEVRAIQVFDFDVPYVTDGYDLVRDRVLRAGWAGPPPL